MNFLDTNPDLQENYLRYNSTESCIETNRNCRSGTKLSSVRLYAYNRVRTAEHFSIKLRYRLNSDLDSVRNVLKIRIT
jgi:hypothetical protein